MLKEKSLEKLMKKNKQVYLVENILLNNVKNENGLNIFEPCKNTETEVSVVCVESKNKYIYFVTNDWKNFFGTVLKTKPGNMFLIL